MLPDERPRPAAVGSDLLVVSPDDADGLELRVNFGLFTGREATAAQIDELGRELLPVSGPRPSERVGNYQYNPQWGPLLSQLWVR